MRDLEDLVKRVWEILAVFGGLLAIGAGGAWATAKYLNNYASAARVESVAADLGVLTAKVEVHEAQHAEQMRRVDSKLDELTDGVKQSNSMIFRVLQEGRGRRRSE